MALVEHEGIVVASKDGQVTIKIVSHSACSACEAHGKCGFSENKEKEVLVRTKDWKEYCEGDSVSVGIESGLGLKAASVAYILPGILMVVVFLLSNKCLGDLWSAIVTLGVVALYWGLLAMMKGRMQQKFTFKLSKK